MKQYVFVRDIKPYKKGDKASLSGFFESYYLDKGIIQPALEVAEKPIKKRAKKGDKTK